MEALDWKSDFWKGFNPPYRITKVGVTVLLPYQIDEEAIAKATEKALYRWDAYRLGLRRVGKVTTGPELLFRHLDHSIVAHSFCCYVGKRKALLEGFVETLEKYMGTQPLDIQEAKQRMLQSTLERNLK